MRRVRVCLASPAIPPGVRRDTAVCVVACLATPRPRPRPTRAPQRPDYGLVPDWRCSLLITSKFEYRPAAGLAICPRACAHCKMPTGRVARAVRTGGLASGGGGGAPPSQWAAGGDTRWYARRRPSLRTPPMGTLERAASLPPSTRCRHTPDAMPDVAPDVTPADAAESSSPRRAAAAPARAAVPRREDQALTPEITPDITPDDAPRRRLFRRPDALPPIRLVANFAQHLEPGHTSVAWGRA